MKLIIICWRSNSGKTTLANEISKKFWIKRISSSDYTKSLITDHSRKALEAKFYEIAREKWYIYQASATTEFWNFENWIWIIDWLRLKDQLKWFEDYLWKENILSIWISISKENRFSLAKKECRIESSCYNDFCDYELNSTTEKYCDELTDYCDFKIWDEWINDKENTQIKIFNYANQFIK